MEEILNEKFVDKRIYHWGTSTEKLDKSMQGASG